MKPLCPFVLRLFAIVLTATVLFPAVDSARSIHLTHSIFFPPPAAIFWPSPGFPSMWPAG